MGLAPCNKSFVHKIIIALFNLIPSTLNDPIMVWSTIPADIITQPLCYLLLATGTSEMDKIHPLAHLPGPSNVTWDSFMKITFRKVNFHVFFAQFWCIEIFPLKGNCPVFFFVFVFFYSFSILHLLLFSTLLIPAFSKIWRLVKSGCFVITFFSLCSSLGSSFLKPFPLLQVLSLYFLWYFEVNIPF